MNTFVKATKQTQSERRTDNGMKTWDSSLQANVDLFFLIGSSRGKDITAQFERAYQEDRQKALRILFWARDIRGGAGERGTFRNLVKYIEANHSNELSQIVELTAEYGRWDDLLEFTSPEAKSQAFSRIKKALLVEKNGLCAKWMPRKGAQAAELRSFLGLTPKGYRKTLVSLTKVVETQMCARQWTEINYEHVPSVASARYQKAFSRHDPAGYTVFKTKLVTGEAKINSSTLYPYDVLRSVRSGDKKVALAQWEALPNYIGEELVLPMVDVSGSMTCPVGGYGSGSSISCMDVALSLGLYLADKNSGPFKDMFLTFSEKPKIEILKGNLLEKLNQMERSTWGMNTNLHKAFEEILRVATSNKVKAEDMPRYVLILSDMQFDACTIHDDSAMEMIRRKYEATGYKAPNVIFWNLNARAGNVPVSYNESGTALISGFNPSIVTSVLKAENVTPENIMLQTINSLRYANVL